MCRPTSVTSFVGGKSISITCSRETCLLNIGIRQTLTTTLLSAVVLPTCKNIHIPSHTSTWQEIENIKVTWSCNFFFLLAFIVRPLDSWILINMDNGMHCSLPLNYIHQIIPKSKETSSLKLVQKPLKKAKAFY